MIIQGSVKKITYYNQENGYGVVKVELDQKSLDLISNEIDDALIYSNMITVVSMFVSLPFIDHIYTFEGCFERNKYGLQFKSDKTFKAISQSSNGIIAYLSSDLFKGVGKQSALKIYNALGEDALKKIIEDKDCLKSAGIKTKQIDIIYDTLCAYQKEEADMVELLSFGISLKFATKIIKTLKKNALATVRENPYSLIEKVEGIGFLRADEIALKVGIDKKSPYRIKALILYVMQNYIYSSGNTYLHLNDLYIECIKLANRDEEIVNKDNFVSLIEELKESNNVVVDENNNIYDVKINHAESEVARNVIRFLNQDLKYKFDEEKIDDRLEAVERQNNIVYNEKQREAIKKALLEPIVIISGGPGTGKSTIIKGIIETYSSMFSFEKQDLMNKRIVLAAPTGRASKRLKELTLHEVSTIHKLLGYTGKIFTVDSIDAELIIIDEFSMVDIFLAFHLFNAIKDGTRVVIVGDSDQLPAVGAGDILNDLILSKEVSLVRLKQIHRQAATSTIINLAHSVNQGIIPDDIFTMMHDRKLMCCDDEAIINNSINVIERYLESESKKSDCSKNEILVNDVQVLVPMYKGSVGIDAFNFYMQEKFNPQTKDNLKQIIIGNRKFRVNDKVIQLVNRAEKGVMNGDIGYISRIEGDFNNYTGLYIQYSFKLVYYEINELDDISLAYAISIHKAQGSEFKLVIMPLSFKYYIMLKKKLVYTAITRAKNYLFMIGNFEAFRKGVINIEEKRRTRLEYKIKQLINNPNVLLDNESGFSEIIIDELENLNPYDFMD